jgi:hypothetical protein
MFGPVVKGSRKLAILLYIIKKKLPKRITAHGRKFAQPGHPDPSGFLLRFIAHRAFIRYDQGCQMVSFHTKIPFWVNFGGPKDEKCWHILWQF